MSNYLVEVDELDPDFSVSHWFNLFHAIPKLAEEMTRTRPGGFDGNGVCHVVDYQIPNTLWILKDVDVDLVMYDLCCRFFNSHDNDERNRVATHQQSLYVIFKDGMSVLCLQDGLEYLSQLRLIGSIYSVMRNKLAGETDMNGKTILENVNETIGNRFIINIIIDINIIIYKFIFILRLVAYTVEDKPDGEMVPIKWNATKKLRKLERMFKRRLVSRREEAEYKLKEFGLPLSSSVPNPFKERVRASLVKEVVAFQVTPIEYYRDYFLRKIPSQALDADYAKDMNIVISL